MSNILLVNDNVKDYNIIINACNDNTYAITYNKLTDTYATIFTKYEKIVAENNIQVLNHLVLVSHGSNNPEFTFLEKENKMLISQYFEDLSVNPPDYHKYIVDLSLNLTHEELDSKESYTYDEVISIFKDVSCDILETFYDISNKDDTYAPQVIQNMIERTFNIVTFETENIENETDLSEMALTDPEDILSLVNSEGISSDSPLNSINKFIINNLDTWTNFKEFIKKFNIQISLDFLGCALLQSADWKYVLETLETEQHLHLTIRASDDATGNLKVGADWVLESDNVNIKELYFNGESIEKWNYTLTPTFFLPNGSTPQTGTIQTFTVPTTGDYEIEAIGATGGSSTLTPNAWGNLGLGAVMKGTFPLQQGNQLKIMVGKQGFSGGLSNPVHLASAGGGGGGTFVVMSPGTQLSHVLIVAGGGGGKVNYGTQPVTDCNARLNAPGLTPPTNGGTLGAYSSWSPGGGGGFLGDGQFRTGRASGGESFVTGGEGGYEGYLHSTVYKSTGGYGGGGGSGALCGGGGGGIQGGNGGIWLTSGTPNNSPGGKGGLSFNTGSNKVDAVSWSFGHGKVTITMVSGPPVWPTTSLVVPMIDIKFSDLYVALVNDSNVPNPYQAISFDGDIRNTKLVPTTGASLPSSGVKISINTDFKGRTFAAGGSTGAPAPVPTSIPGASGGLGNTGYEIITGLYANNTSRTDGTTSFDNRGTTSRGSLNNVPYPSLIIQAKPGDVLNLIGRINTSGNYNEYCEFWVWLGSSWSRFTSQNATFVGDRNFSVNYTIPSNTAAGNYALAVACSYGSLGSSSYRSWKSYSLHVWT